MYVARLVGSDRQIVADIVQEVFLAAAKGMSSFDGQRGTLLRWLLGIAHRQTALSHRRERNFFTSDIALAALIVPESESPDMQFDHAERATVVRSVLAKLPEDMAMLLIGRYLDDRSTADLAEAFCVSEDAIRSRLVRAREKFREQFVTDYRDFVK